MISTEKRLSQRLQIALDLIRSSAAVYVVLHHTLRHADIGHFRILFSFGQEAVITFFLLSGFVIHLNERDRLSKIGCYASRRIFRIYPTLAISMLISVSIFLANKNPPSDLDPYNALCTIFALQDSGSLKPGTICNPFLGNEPLWSLSYEIFFYALYPLFFRLFKNHPRRAQHILGLLTIGLILIYAEFPSHFFLIPSYFIIWWCGAIIAEGYLNGKTHLGNIAATLGYRLISSVIWATIWLWIEGFKFTSTYPFLTVRHFFTAVALITLAHISDVRKIVYHFGKFAPRFWAWLSSISFGLYVFHYPILIQWHVARSPVGFFFSAILLAVIAHLGDRWINQKIRRRRRVNRSTLSPC